MKQIFWIGTILFSIFILSISSFAQTIILRDMHVQNTTQQTRVRFYLFGKTHYRTFMLHHPNRFVIDLKNVRNFQALHFPFANYSAVTDFKYATHQKGFFRVVFGVASLQSPKIQAIYSNQHHESRIQITFQNSKKQFHVIPIPAANTPEKTVLSNNLFTEGQKNYRKIIVVIDPGHGGKDPGATGPGGAHEKTIVLQIAKKLQRMINQQPGYQADLTRTADYYLTLRQRLHIARRDKADMFIAIHADTWKNTIARGVSVFALSQKGATSEAARWLATQENASELMGGVNLNDKSHLLKSVLINLSQAATVRSSLEIGNDLLQTIKPIAHLHHDRVEQAAFVVLKSPDIPSLLVETGFLSNPREEMHLKNSVFQKKLAVAISQGIFDYFRYHPPRGTWLSYWRRKDMSGEIRDAV